MSYLLKLVLLTFIAVPNYASDESYQRGSLSILTFKDLKDETTILYSAVKGERLPSISSNFAVEFAFLQSATDFSFNFLDIAFYGVYSFPLVKDKLYLSTRIGTSYSKVDLKNIILIPKEEVENIEGVFLTYGLSLHYKTDNDLGFFLELKENKFSQNFSFGGEVGF